MTFVQGYRRPYKNQVSVTPFVALFVILSIAPILLTYFRIDSEIDELEKASVLDSASIPYTSYYIFCGQVFEK